MTFIFILPLTTLLILTTPTHSLTTCSSQTFTSNNLFSNCTNLPSLNSSLHWTHVTKTSSLSIAFIAPQSSPHGWVAWAINPTQTGMAGSQALIAFKDSNGSMTVKTYNISSYSSLVEGKIAFEVTDTRAEFSGGSMKIFATVKLPEKMMEVNHVWQIGGSVVEGVPVKHEFQPENLSSKGKLQFKLTENGKGNGNGNGVTVGSPGMAPSPATRTSVSSGSSKNGMCVFLVVIIGALILS